MGFRYYRGISLGKLARLNISKSGVGLSVGVRGLRWTTGPGGTFLTLGIPGTGLSYRKKVGKAGGLRWDNMFGFWGKDKDAPNTDQDQDKAKDQADAAAPDAPIKIRRGMSAVEKKFVEGLNLYRAGDTDQSLGIFMSLASQELGAAVLAAAILAEVPGNAATVERLLRRIVHGDEEIEFPTPLMQTYLSDAQIDIEITPNVTASMPIDLVSITLLLVEMYQQQQKMDLALGLLEELDELTEGNIPVITLSLCELYAVNGLWDGVIDRGQGIENATDDIALAIMVFYGRALQEKGLDDGAISVFTRALRRRKNLNPDLRHEARYWRAQSYLAIGKRKRAREDYEKLFAEAPTFRDVAHKVGLK